MNVVDTSKMHFHYQTQHTHSRLFKFNGVHINMNKLKWNLYWIDAALRFIQSNMQMVKGSLISEGIANKGAKSFRWAENLNK